ncbi:MAG TPA: FG-GAP-like repeat-containing protein, partial [Terriglobales bacterium]|nr:FG-GAP-like repeat-containing protein [Terriglobales bacterium]
MTILIRQRRISLLIVSFILWSASAALAQVTFSGPTNYNGDNTPYAVAAGDFNGDGKIDLAFPNLGSDDVSILLGNGNGTFGAATNVPLTAGSGPQYAAVGDFNGDGKLDLAIADNASGMMSVLLGNGNGTFQAAVNYAAGTNPRDIVARDLNGDGKIDLIVSNSGANTISVYIGNGDGTFKPQVTYTVGNSARAVVVGDFNKDGKLDLAVTNTNDNTVSILLGNGDGTFKPQVTYATGNAPWFLCTGDFLGNGNLDLAIANNNDNNVSVLLGNGDGTFQAQRTYAAGAGAHSIETYDFNGDGILDLVVANNGSNNISILLGNGDGSFQAPTNFTVGNGPKGMFLGDLNADGRADIAVANVGAGNVSVLLNTTASFPKMTVTGPANITAGTPFSITVTLKSSGVTYTAYRGTIHFTSSDIQAGLPANYTFTAADAGVHTFTNLITLKTAGNQTVTTTDTLNSYDTGTLTVAVGPAAASVFTVTAPANATAGTAFNITVTAKDAYGNIATGYTGTVHFTSTDGQSVLPANYTFVAGDNGVHVFSVTLKTAANETVTATDTVTGSVTGTSSAIPTSPAAASQFTVTAPAGSSAGAAFSVTVTAKDPYGNIATGYRGTAHFTSSDGQAVLPANYTFTAADNGAHTFANAVTLKTAGNQTVTATDTVTATITGSATVAVTFAAGGATQFTVTAPANSSAGAAFNVTVTAKDQYGNTVTNYTGTVHFTSSDAQAVLPANYTFVAGDNGSHTFANGVTLKTAGSKTVTATDTVTGTITGSATVTVTFAAGGATQFAVIAPASTAAGAAFNVTVTAQDQYGNTVTNYTGTAHFTSSDAQAVLPANYTFVAGDNGSHTFANGVTLKTAGSKTVTATDTVTGTITGSATVTVNPAVASVFTVTVPANATAGTAFNVTVTARDAYGNVATGYTGTVHFTSTDGQAVLPANYTFVAGDNGVHIFSVTLKTAGNQTITATDTVTGSITGTSSAVGTSAAAVSVLTVTAPANSSAGAAFNVTVTAKDQYGNVATGYLGTVHFTTSDGQGTVPGNYTFVAGDNGVHTFANGATLKTAGSQTVTATDTVTGTITGFATVNVTFAAGGATKLLVTAPASSSAGTAFNVTVTAQDQYGNTVTNYAGTVHFTTSDGQGTVPGNYTFVAGDNGVHTFANGVTLKTAGSQTVTATDTVTGSITGFATVNVTFAAGGATKLLVAAPASTTAGSAFNVTVTAQDQYGNTVTNYAGTVHFTSSDGTAVLPGNYTFVAGDNGAHTFANGVTLKTVGSRTVTATDTVTGSITGFATVTVTAAAATHYTVTTSLSSVAAGTAMSVTVTALDQFNNVATGYVGTAHFTSSDAQAVLPGNYTFVAGDNGVHTFTNLLTFKTAGSQTVTATDTATGTITGTSAVVTVTFASGGATKLLVTAPASSSAGAAFNVTVTAQDQYGNTVTNYAGAVHFTTSDGQGTVPANYTFVAGDNGVHVFANGVTLKTAGSQTVTATDTVTGSINGTATVNVTFAAGGATKLLVTAPASSSAGAAFNVTVTAQDQYGNTVTNYAGTVHFTSSDGAAVLPGNYTFVAGDNGVHVFANGVTLKTAGSRTVTATDTVTGTITGFATVNVTFAAGGATKLLVTAPASSS